MGRIYFKILVIILLSSFLVIYTNCGSPSKLEFNGEGSNIYGGSAEESYKAFEQTVYPLTRNNCVSCHVSQQPLHASADVKEAHDAVINQYKVNFENISSSRLVVKLRDDNHNCWSDCKENAQEMQAAIEAWKDKIKNSGGRTPSSETGWTVTTSQSMTLGEALSTLPRKTVHLNIHSAMLKAPMELKNDATPHLWVPNTKDDTLTATDPNAGLAFFYFDVNYTGRYKIYALVQNDTGNDDSFFLNLFDGERSLFTNARNFSFNTRTFQWRDINLGADLVVGKTYKMELRQRKDGARLAGLAVSIDPELTLQRLTEPAPVTLTFDLSKIVNIPDVFLDIDVIDYDAYSYKFSKPRISTPSGSIYVKGLKVLVNKVFNPQHSTYTIVEKVVTPESGILSESAMVVLKDKGKAKDRISISFEELIVVDNNNGSNGGNGGGAGTLTSLEAFERTMYPITRSSAYSCVGCHTAQTPRHAADTSFAAHTAALTVVDFNNAQNSRIVKKMRDERHNCQNYCDNIANEFEDAIREWKNLRE